MDSSIRKHNQNTSLIIDSLIKIITKPDTLINTTDYYYRVKERQEFICSLTLLRLLVNNLTYFEEIYNENSGCLNIELSKLTNYQSQSFIKTLQFLKEKLKNDNYLLKKDNKIYFNDTWFDIKILLRYLTIIINMDKFKENELTFYEIIAPDELKPIDNNNYDEFLSQFVYCQIILKEKSNNIPNKDASLTTLKNAVHNYLKHVKRFHQHLEEKESTIIFYGILKNECTKQNYEMIEKEIFLNELPSPELTKLKKHLNSQFANHSPKYQLHFLENLIWHLNNDRLIQKMINKYIDSLLKFLKCLNNNDNKLTYNTIIKKYHLNSYNIIIILAIHKFSLNFLLNHSQIDYSLLDLKNVKPERMKTYLSIEEEKNNEKIAELKAQIEDCKKELALTKEEKKNLKKEELGLEKYLKKLEVIINKINGLTTKISKIKEEAYNVNQKHLEKLNNQKKQYKDLKLYDYNSSIIKHICASITNATFYLKANSSKQLLENTVIFEDTTDSDNIFYLEISFKDLLRISNQKIINGLEEKLDLPKLAE